MWVSGLTLHETGNWLDLTVCSNAFNAVKRTAVHAEAANCGPALTPLCGHVLWHKTR